MTASLDAPSLSSKRTFLRIATVDGNFFTLPAVDDIDVTNFMSGVKANQWLGTPDWFMPYEAILWVVKVIHAGDAMNTEGMVKQ